MSSVGVLPGTGLGNTGLIDVKMSGFDWLVSFYGRLVYVYTPYLAL